MKLLFALFCLAGLSTAPARADKTETVPVLDTQKHQPISLQKCTCRSGYHRESQVPRSTCEASLHGRVQEYAVYNDICRSIEISQHSEGPTESATSFLGPKEVIVGISYGEQNFEISEDWMKAVVAN